MNEKNITPEEIYDEECERLNALDSNARVILEGFWELEEYADIGNQATKQEDIPKAYEVAALFEIALALRELRKELDHIGYGISEVSDNLGALSNE